MPVPQTIDEYATHEVRGATGVAPSTQQCLQGFLEGATPVAPIEVTGFAVSRQPQADGPSRVALTALYRIQPCGVSQLRTKGGV